MGSNGISISSFGQTFTLENDIESVPLELHCYCDRCVVQRKNYNVVLNNFLYGITFVPFLFFNIFIYIRTLSLAHDYKFSESIQWTHQSQITLLNPVELDQFLRNGNVENQDNLVLGVIKQHHRCNQMFRKWVGYSGMALITWVLLALMIWLVFISSS